MVAYLVKPVHHMQRKYSEILYYTPRITHQCGYIHRAKIIQHSTTRDIFILLFNYISKKTSLCFYLHLQNTYYKSYLLQILSFSE